MLFTDLPSSHAQASCSGDGQVRPRHGIVGLAAREIKIVLDFDICVADALDVDLERALADKMVKNAAKYPVEAARGRASKYTDLENESVS